MNLVHFSKTKFSLSKKRDYQQEDPKFNFKPRGLWVSDESASMNWSRWCRDNHFQEQNLKYKTELDITLSEVLLIKSKRRPGLYGYWQLETSQFGRKLQAVKRLFATRIKNDITI